MKTLLTIPVFLLLALLVKAQEAQDTWIPNREVSHLTRGDGKIFMSGDFDWYGESHQLGFAVLNTELGGYDNAYPGEDYYARTAISDDAGGWYISSYSIISHVKADKTVEDLPFVFEGGGYPINALEKVGNILYVGGNFTTINGVATRRYAAAIDLTTNTLTSWNPDPNGYVYTVKSAGSVVYVGGSFTTIGGLTRYRIAAIDAATGLATSWNANVATSFGYVYTIAVGPSNVYFGGGFTNVGGGSPSRRNFAAVNNTTGALTTFNPRPDSYVDKILLDGNTLYIAGDFTQVDGVSKSVLVAMDVTTGLFTSFSTTFGNWGNSNIIYALAIDGQKLFLGGYFSTINGAERARLAVVDKTTGALEPMQNREMSDYVLTIAVSGGKVLVGGSFRGISGITSSIHCIALDEATGQATSWRPEILQSLPSDAYIADLTLHHQDNRVYYSEKIYFSSDSHYETVIGAVNTTDGAAIGWTATVNGNVEVWAFSGNTLYIAGEFSDVNGAIRDNFAAIDLSTGNLLSYSPSHLDGLLVRSMAVHNNILYIGGDFSFNDGGVDRINLAAWNATTAAINSWAPQAGPGITRIAGIHNSKVYVTGSDVMRVDATSGEIDEDWQPDLGGVYEVAVLGTYVFLSGPSPGLVQVDIETGEFSSWQPSLEDVESSEGSINAIAISGTRLFVGGDFGYEVSGAGRAYFAMYLLPEPINNEPPQILATTTAVPIEGVVTIDLLSLITDADDNLNLSTLQLLTELSEQGALASISESFELILDYGGVEFFGTDRIGISVCDFLDECTEQELTIEVGGDVFVYNAMSPNGDGSNDSFIIQYIDILPETQSNKVTIYNRWGDSVFEIQNYNNDSRVFKGLNKNDKELPSGTYFYKIDFSNGRASKTGFLSLRR